MSQVIHALQHWADATPERTALQAGLEPGSGDISWRQLARQVDLLAAKLTNADIRVAGMLFDNTPSCVLTDLALVHARIPCVPLPHFFSPSQHAHTLRQAGVNLLLTNMPEQLAALLQAIAIPVSRQELLIDGDDSVWAFHVDITPGSPLPAGTAKITFTSGSTGEPKGVCLQQSVMEQVAESLAKTTSAVAEDSHLTLLPFATLLENIGGVYAPILVGATVILPGLKAIGLSGASGLDPQAFALALTRSRATTCIMIPQMLLALVAMVSQGGIRPEKLRFAAVGGASVSPALLAKAGHLGLPVFEGYGLSEAASVVAVNSPAHHKPGTVGQVLPHVRLRFAEDGEVLVQGALFSGYLGDTTHALADGYWPTGDIGYLDEDGFLHITGRKKHMFITAFGRNVAPEWVERELGIEAAIAQVCVFGEARPFNVAVVVPRDASVVAEAIASANARLPDYARIKRWLLAPSPFTVSNGQWTGTGRPRRQQIWDHYRESIEAIYAEDN